MGAVRYRLRTLLHSSWVAIAGVALVVALTGGLVLTLAAGAVRTVSAPDRYLDSLDHVYDANITIDGRARDAEIGALPSVTSARSATFVFGAFIPEGADEPTDLLVFAGDAIAIGGELVEGRLPRPDEPTDLVITKDVADAEGFRPGDRMHLVTLTAEQGRTEGFNAKEPKGPSLDVTVVGVVDGPAQLQDDSSVGVLPASLLDEGDVGTSASVGAVSLAPGATIADLRHDLRTLPDSAGIRVQAGTQMPDEVRAAVRAQGQGLAVLALIVAVTTLVVLGQLLTRQFRMAGHERLNLRALGYTRSQLVAEPVARAATGVLTGAALAIGIAFASSGLFPRGFVTRVDPHHGLLFDPKVLLVGAAAFVVVLLGWMAVALAAGTRPPPPPRSTGLVDRVAPAIPSATAGLGLRFAFARGSDRRRVNVVGVAGLVAVAALLIGALTFGRSLTRLIDDPLRYGDNYDIGIGQGEEVTPEQVQPLLDPSLRDDIAGVTLYSTESTDAGSLSLNVIGAQPLLGDLGPELLDGRLPAGDDEIALGRLTMRRLHVHIGDSITLRGTKARRRLRVTGLVQPPNVAGSDLIGDAGVLTATGFAELSTAPPLMAAITLAPDAPADTVARIGKALGTQVGPTSVPAKIINVDRVRTIPFVVAAVVAGLAMLSLAHLLLVAVRRRRLDLAVLRALGTSRRGLTGIIHVQATVIGLLVVVLAVPLGIAAGSVVYRRFVDGMGARLDVDVPLGWVLLSAAALLVVANLVAAVPARRARRSSPLATLART